jgi:hypothetical protein
VRSRSPTVSAPLVSSTYLPAPTDDRSRR